MIDPAAVASAWQAGDGLIAAAVLAATAPLAGSALSAVGAGRRSPRTVAVAAASVSLLASLALTLIWSLGDGRPVARGDEMGGGALLFIDGLTAVLMPTVALIELAILLVAPRRALEPSAVARTLFGAGATLALLLTSHPLALVLLWIVTAVPTWLATRATPGGRPAGRVFAVAMVAAIVCMTVGTLLLLADPPWEKASGPVGAAGGWLVAVAVMVRKGIVPFHSWYPALFSGASMSTALAATMPQVAAYTAVRLLIGHADGVASELVMLSQMALVTAAYGGALAIVQRDLRGLIGTLAMSQSAMVLAGLSGTLPMELNGALCIWISSGLALTGIGLVTWALESRAGVIRLDTPQGRFWDAPALAGFFLLFGLATIGLPGTLSFVADDLIVSGSLDEQLHAGLLVIVATVLSGIAVMRGWFSVFGGPVEPDGPRHAILARERIALSALLFPLFALGLAPAPLVRSLERAAGQLLGKPAVTAADPRPAAEESDVLRLHESHGGR
jgi:NADH-quinone oxidoreductase subunit M